MDLIKNVCEYRLLIGFLGEKHQAKWWDSSFLSSSSSAFLAPVFPNSIVMAQYSGVCQAASIVHDEHIGIGRHYHLYRLPDSIERALLKSLHDKNISAEVSKHTVTKDSAIERLRQLGAEEIDRAEGPVAVGDFSDTEMTALLWRSLSHYVDAFQSGYTSFPYMRCL
jgi:hypothetical protein